MGFTLPSAGVTPAPSVKRALRAARSRSATVLAFCVLVNRAHEAAPCSRARACGLGVAGARYQLSIGVQRVDSKRL